MVICLFAPFFLCPGLCGCGGGGGGGGGCLPSCHAMPCCCARDDHELR